MSYRYVDRNLKGDEPRKDFKTVNRFLVLKSKFKIIQKYILHVKGLSLENVSEIISNPLINLFKASQGIGDPRENFLLDVREHLTTL